MISAEEKVCHQNLVGQSTESTLLAFFWGLQSVCVCLCLCLCVCEYIDLYIYMYMYIHMYLSTYRMHYNKFLYITCTRLPQINYTSA